MVALVTGHGLKTVEALAGAEGSAPTATIAPTLDAFDAAVGRPRDQGDLPMSVTVRIPTQLRTLTGGAGEVEVEGTSVGEALKALDAAHPGLADRLFDEAGNLRRFVNVFLADEDVRFLDGLATPVIAGPDALHRPRRRRGLSPGGLPATPRGLESGGRARVALAPGRLRWLPISTHKTRVLTATEDRTRWPRSSPSRRTPAAAWRPA